MTFAIIAAEAPRLDRIRALAAGAATQLQLVLECAGANGLDFAISDVARLQPDIVVLDAGLPGFREIIGRLASASSYADILVLLEDASPESILAVLRAGAQEVALPPHSDLRQLLERIAAKRSIITKPSYGPLIGFLSAKGGCGSTSLAIHTAAGLRKWRTVLLDLDLDAGMVGFLLRIQSQFSLADAAAVHRLDREALLRLTCNFRGSLDVLLAPPPGALDDDCISPAALKAVLRSAKRHYDCAIADLGRGISALNSHVLPCLERLYLVTTPDLAALYRTRETVRWWTGQGLRLGNLWLVVNRLPARPSRSVKEIEQAVGIRVAAAIPDAGRELEEAYISGTLLPRSNKIARELEALTRSMLDALG